MSLYVHLILNYQVTYSWLVCIYMYLGLGKQMFTHIISVSHSLFPMPVVFILKRQLFHSFVGARRGSVSERSSTFSISTDLVLS